jgi:hypothetical protein
MILPGKHIQPDRALVSVGADILEVVGKGASVSDVWARVKVLRAKRSNASPLPFDWFILALTLLYAVSAIEMEDNFIRVPVRG